MINVDSPDYIKCEDEFHFIPGSAEAISILTRAGFDIIIITNQSAIGRNMISTQALEAIFTKMRHGVQQAGGVIKDILYCPHTPDDGCNCRKPAPGLIMQAVAKYGIDLSRSCMVGDSTKDIECAVNAGCAMSILVQTGNGKKTMAEFEHKTIRKHKVIRPDMITADLMDAAQCFLSSKLFK